MTTTNLGRIAIVPKGTWADGSYKALDLVRYNGASYVAKSATTASPTDTNYWQLVNSDGATGAAGPTGATGPAGTTLYTWIKYADDASGTGLSDSPTGKSYIGIAVNKNVATESVTATDYTWSLIKGADGAAGAGGTVTSVAALTITTTGTDLTSTVATGTTTPVITINVPNASASARGVLTAADWSTFNSKQAALSTAAQTFLTTPTSANLLALTSDETGSGSLVFATNPTLVGLKQTRVTMAANDIDLSTGDVFTKTISTTTTFTVSNIPATGKVASFLLKLTNGGSATITWWANMKWVGGIAPTLTASGRDDLGFYTEDNGTTWTGFVLGKDIK